MKTKKIILTFLLAIPTFILSATITYAQSRKGYEIMKKNDQLKEPSDAYSEGTLILTDKRGNQKQRKMKMYTRKRDEGYDSFFEILSPADVAGMKFLTLARKGDDEQRMYLPAMGKSRKIASSGKDGKFLGSDIYFYDLEDHDLDDFTYKYLKNETWNGKEYYVVEAYPGNEDAPYSKLVNWVRVDNYYVYKMEMYDKKQNRLLKTMKITETSIMQGIILTIRMEVINHLENSKTLYSQTKNKINIGLSEDIFTVRNLEN
ncbi:MAG: outer membrane lipoprotein-sorting protein [Bacteroidales bacterium]|jgi:hypothetical protein